MSQSVFGGSRELVMPSKCIGLVSTAICMHEAVNVGENVQQHKRHRVYTQKVVEMEAKVLQRCIYTPFARAI